MLLNFSCRERLIATKDTCNARTQHYRHLQAPGHSSLDKPCRSKSSRPASVRNTAVKRLQASASSRQQRPQVAAYQPAAATRVPQSNPQEIIRSFYDALNRRDTTAVAGCFAPNATYENLAVEGVLSGREAVAQFCIESMSAVPDDAEFILEQQTGGLSSSIAVVWRLVLGGSQTVMSRGIAFYTLNTEGFITGVTECHEHPVKMSQSSLSLVRPLVKNLSGPMLPAMQEASRTFQQGIDSLLDPFTSIANLVQSPLLQADQPAASTAAAPSQPAIRQQQQQQQQRQVVVAAASSSSSSANGSSYHFSQPAAAAAAGVGRPASPYARVQAAAARRSAAANSPVAAAAAVGSAGQGPDDGQAQPEMVDLSGLWAKDAARSDAKGYEAILDLMGLSGLQKVTARLIEGIDIKQTANQLTVSFVTVVPFFKVTETVPLDAGTTQQSRRDLRPGKQTAGAKRVTGGVLVEMSWGQPVAGSLTELYTVLPDGALCVHAEARIGQQQAAADTVYVRSKGSREALLSESRKKNGSLNDVLQRQ